MISSSTVKIWFVVCLLFQSSTISSAVRRMPNICPEIVTKAQWEGRTPDVIDYNIKPVNNVVIQHTVTPQCRSKQACIARIQNIQDYLMDEVNLDDIGYNFLVGSDGRIYEGCGWHVRGAHTYGYNSKSLGLAFIGNFQVDRPSDTMLKAGRDFIQCARELGEISENYKLFAAKDISSTLSPGKHLYDKIKHWTHFTKDDD